MQSINEKPESVAVPAGFLQRLKTKWELESTLQVILVLIVFSCTGSTVVFIKKSLFLLFGFDDNTPFWIKAVTYISCILPLYQVLLLVYGFIFGQFNFFWNKEKKMLKGIKRLFVRR